MQQAVATGQVGALAAGLLSGDDTFTIGFGRYEGGPSNDTFNLPSVFPATIDGGQGIDQAAIPSLHDDEQVAVSGKTVTIAPGITDSSGTATLTSVETLEFRDGSLWTNPGTAGGIAYGLFAAILGRAPETGPLSYWANTVQANGATSVATGLLTTAEAHSVSGTDDQGLIASLYTNALGRAVDSAGLIYWTGLLTSGTSRGAVVAAIVQTAEAQARLAPTFQTGVFAPSQSAVEEDRLYLAFSGQLPTALQLDYDAIAHLDTAKSLALYGNAPASNVDFVHMLQTNTYGSIDPAATDYFVGQLGIGAGTRADVLLAYAHSPGIDIRLAPTLNFGVVHH